MSRVTLLLAGAVLGGACAALAAAVPSSLRNDDLALASVANTMTVASVKRCQKLMPATGIVLAAIDQYAPAQREQARRDLGFGTPLGIEAVVPGSAADRAGLRAGDGLVVIGDAALAGIALAPAASSAARDSAERDLAQRAPGQPFQVRILRGNQSLAYTLQPSPACRTRFEVLETGKLVARSDGETIQISSGFIERFGPDGLAVAFAHELAHTLLGHRQALAAGGDRQAAREAERAADRLSVHLLVDAGYDPAIAPAFWRRYGSKLGSGAFGAVHDSAKRRIALLEAEIAKLRQGLQPSHF